MELQRSRPCLTQAMLTLAIVCLTMEAFGQFDGLRPLPEQPLRNLDERAGSYAAARPTEKIYIHFDRPFYLATDTCWYSVYVVDSWLLPTPFSQVVYVDLIGPKGAILRHQPLQVTEGRASGDFTFSAQAGGRYHVRAYTNLMRNETHADFFFRAEFSVIDPSTTRSGPAGSKPQPGIDAQFFPEGGTMVYGLESHVAFKATDSRGEGIDVSGRVMDDLGQPVSFLQSTRKGMGIFPLKPAAGRSYRVLLSDGSSYNLPIPAPTGFTLRVSNRSREKVLVMIQGSSNLLPADLYLVGQSGGRICYRDHVTIDRLGATVEIVKDSIPAGVFQLTLFDHYGVPQSERLLFINGREDFKVDIDFDKPQYGPREPVSVGISVRDKNGAPVSGQFSIAITDADYSRRKSLDQNIKTYLLLQSDLRGKIEEPGWYFDSLSAEKTYALDLVMLTHGWRKFQWQDVLSDNVDSLEYLPENSLTVNGRVVTGRREEPVADAEVTLLTNSPGSEFFQANSNADGKFKIEDINFTDSTQFVWQIRNRKGNQADALIRFIAPDIPRVDSAAILSLASGTRDDFEDYAAAKLRTTGIWNPAVARMLENVDVRGRRINPEGSIIPEDPHRNTLYPAEDEYNVYTDMTQLLANKFPNITLIGWGINMDIRIRGVNKRLSPGSESSPVILLDGMRIMTDGDFGGVYNALNIIPVSEVRKVEVLTGAAASIYGSQAGSGVIAIYSRTGERGSSVGSYKSAGKGILKVRPPGYSWPRKFYEPRYDETIVAPLPDYRMTLYWNPAVTIDESGKTTVQFYNSDIAKKFQAVVEGLCLGVPVFRMK